MVDFDGGKGGKLNLASASTIVRHRAECDRREDAA
jgi:hypothetical protein